MIALPFRSVADDCERGCLARAGEALDSLDAVRRAENIFDHALLCLVEMRVLVGNGDGVRARKNRLDMVCPSRILRIISCSAWMVFAVVN